MLETLQQDYVRTARAKGLRYRRVVTVHVLRNSLTPTVTVLGPVLGGIITGTFIIEEIFAVPGIGRYYVGAVQDRDYSVVMGLTVVLAIIIYWSVSSVRALTSVPAPGRALVGSREKSCGRLQQDLEVDEWRSILDVPHVELDSLLPGKRGSALDLGPARDSWFDLEPPALPRRIPLDLIRECWPRANKAHVTPHHVPELRELIE